MGNGKSSGVDDARKLNKPDNSADVVLLMGPLYHLQNKDDRNKALSEAFRVLKKVVCSLQLEYPDSAVQPGHYQFTEALITFLLTIFI